MGQFELLENRKDIKFNEAECEVRCCVACNAILGICYNLIRQ